MLKQLSASLIILSTSTAFALSPAESLFCRGLVRQGNFDYARAIADFTEAIRANPRYAEAYFYRGTAFYARGLSRIPRSVEQDRRDFEATNANYNQALKLGYFQPHLIYINRGNARGNLGDYRGAIADLTEGIRLTPPPYNPVTTYEQRALAYLYLGNRRAAANDLTQAANLYQRQLNGRNDYLSTLDLAERVLSGKITPRQLGINWTATTNSDGQTKCP